MRQLEVKLFVTSVLLQELLDETQGETRFKHKLKHHINGLQRELDKVLGINMADDDGLSVFINDAVAALSKALRPNYMKIDVAKLIILSGKMNTQVINSRAWAHGDNDLRRFLRMYLTGYTLTEIGDYFDMTYGSVYSALTVNLISKSLILPNQCTWRTASGFRRVTNLCQ